MIILTGWEIVTEETKTREWYLYFVKDGETILLRARNYASYDMPQITRIENVWVLKDDVEDILRQIEDFVNKPRRDNGAYKMLNEHGLNMFIEVIIRDKERLLMQMVEGKMDEEYDLIAQTLNSLLWEGEGKLN